jgi:glycosyltransferase involved in cell wall biosynthesis
MQQGLATVIIPAYNRERLIGSAIESALAQTWPFVEIIVVDDGSTDATTDVASRYPLAHCIRQKNQGPSAARNTGLSLMTGEFVAFLDSDDLWDTGFLSRSIEMLKDNPALGMIISNWREINGENEVRCPDYFAKRRWFTSECVRHQTLRMLSHEEARRWFLQSSPAPPTAVVMRRQMVNVAWNTRIRVGEDRLFFLTNLLRVAAGAGVLLQPNWSFRCHGGNAYQNHPRPDLIAFRDNRCLRELFRVVPDLRPGELEALRSSQARNYLDWGYYLSASGNPSKAKILLRASLRRKPTWKACKAFLGTWKCAARSVPIPRF